MRSPSTRLLLAAIAAGTCCSVALGQAPAPLAEARFTLHRNAVIVEALVNGRDTVRLLLDTGWGPLALLRTTADRLRLPVTPGGGYPLARAATLGIGRAVQRDVTFELFAPEVLAPLIGPYDGVLGTAFFHDLVLQLDYPHSIVRFFAGTPGRPLPRDSSRLRASLPLVFSPGAGALPFTDSIRVDGRQVRGLFDTGGQGAFLAMPRLVERAGLELYPDTGKVGIGMMVEGQARTARLRFARAGRIAVGPLVREIPRLMVAPAQLEGTSWGHDLIIGYGFLKDFIVTFDYPSRVISLEGGP